MGEKTKWIIKRKIFDCTYSQPVVIICSLIYDILKPTMSPGQGFQTYTVNGYYRVSKWIEAGFSFKEIIAWLILEIRREGDIYHKS